MTVITDCATVIRAVLGPRRVRRMEQEISGLQAYSRTGHPGVWV